MAETFTLYKLIVLYMLDRVDFPLTTSQISEFILDKGYTTYFRLQSALAELTDSGLLKIELTDNILNTNHEFEVKCQILENGSHLFDMTLTVPTQTEAEAIVNNWNRKNQEIYALLLSQLL